MWLKRDRGLFLPDIESRVAQGWYGGSAVIGLGLRVTAALPLMACLFLVLDICSCPLSCTLARRTDGNRGKQGEWPVLSFLLSQRLEAVSWFSRSTSWPGTKNQGLHYYREMGEWVPDWARFIYVYLYTHTSICFMHNK